MHKYAFDANLFERGMVDSIHTRRAHEKYVELAEALRFFDAPDDVSDMPLFRK